MAKKVIRFLSDTEDRLLGIFFLLVLIIGLYGVYDTLIIYRDAIETGMLKFRQVYAQEEEEKEIKGFVAAWISVDGTSIDFPVMQGPDNSEYLNKNPYGEYSLSGSIFLDYRNSPDFTDSYNLIYGHHMEGGMMFGALDSFLDQKYLEKHRSGTVEVDGKEYPLTLFAAFQTQAGESKIFNPEDESADTKLGFIKKEAWVMADPPESAEGIRLVVLTTCKSPESFDRTIVAGYIPAP